MAQCAALIAPYKLQAKKAEPTLKARWRKRSLRDRRRRPAARGAVGL